MMEKGKRHWLLVLLGVGLGIGYLVLFGYLLWGDVPGIAQPMTAAPPTVRLSAHGEAPTQALIGLWDAYQQARAAVQVQAEDARLVSASTQWQAASEQTLLAGASTWSFVFYSAASSSSLDVGVSAGAARVVNQTRVWVAPTAIVEGTWRVGPKDALLALLAYGGRAFLEEHSPVVVDLHLAGNADGRPVWTIVALDPEDRSLLSLLVDAETGQVLSD